MSTYSDASLILPVAPEYKAGKIYSLKPTDGDGDFVFSRSTTGTEIDGNGDVATKAIDVPRFSFDEGLCPYLLLERSSTNLMPYSEDFTGWNISAGSSVVLTAIDNPVNQTNANLITIDSSGIFRNVTTTPSFNATCSVWIHKNGETGSINLTNAQGITLGEWVIDLDALPNEFTRVYKRHPSVTVNYNFSTTAGGEIAPRFVSATTKSVYVQGFQLELGDVKSSYIKTLASSVTRTVDSASITNFSDAPTAFPFTIYAEVYIENVLDGTVFSFLDITTSDVYFNVDYISASQKFVIEYRNGASDVQTASADTFGRGWHKVAATYISNNEKSLYVDGTEQVNDTHTNQAFNASINDVLIGQLRVVADGGVRNSIKDFKIFNLQLTANQLTTLTTL